MRQSWTKTKVQDSILGLHKKTGKLHSIFAQRHHLALYSASKRLFGSWQKAVEAAGFDYESIRVKRAHALWTKQAVIAEIKKRHQQKLPLNAAAMRRDDRRLYAAATECFGPGGWNKALKKIGLSSLAVYASRKWTPSRIIAEISRLYSRGQPLYIWYMQKNGYGGLVGSARKQFGSWRQAIEAAGLNYDDIAAHRLGYWTPLKVVQEIKKLARQGTRLSSDAMKWVRGDIYAQARIFFGSWQRAVEAAGINYRKHVLIWSTKAWLRSLTKADVAKLIKRSQTLARR